MNLIVRLVNWQAVTLCLLLVSAQLIPELFQWSLQYQRAAFSRGEIWYGITGHLVHLSWAHLAINALAAYLIIDLFRPVFRRGTLWFLIIVLSLLISCGLYLFYPGLKYYFGFSGVLHGLLLAGLFGDGRYPGWARNAIFAGIVLKIGWEQSFYYDESSVAAIIGGPVAEQAHLLGVLAGCLCVLISRSTSNIRL